MGKAPTGTELAGAAVPCCPELRSKQQIKRGLAPTPSFLTTLESVQPMTRPPRGLCAAGGIERTNSGAGVDRPLQLRCGPLRGTGRREPQDWAHPRQARAALPAACAAVCAKGNWAHPPSEKSSKRRPGSGRDAESTAQIRQQLKRRDSSIGNSIGRGKRPEGRSDFLLSQSKFLPQERALSPLPSRQQLCRQASAYLEGKSRLAITGVRSFRWARRGYAGPESLR